MLVDLKFINYYMHINSSRKHIDTDLCYKMFGCKNEAELNSKMSSINVAIITEIVESGLTLLEYCSTYGGSFDSFEKIAASIRNENLNLYKKFRKICTKESSQEFYLYIKSIAEEMILKGESFDSFDYYYYTKLDPLIFKRICENLMSPEELKLINPRLTKLKIRRYYEYTDIEFEMSGVIIIKGYELSQEEKNKITQYLIENNMPLEALRPAFRKYVNGDERLVSYVNQSKKVKDDKLNGE